jgi:predicted P-loop ATPase
MKNAYHPVRNYIQSIQWDGVRRVNKWLHTYAGADDNKYSSFVGEITLVAAVARVFKPGIKYDHMLILEGEQGIGKSEMFKILAGEWFSEISLIDKNKDTIDKMLGCWILEVAEMDVFKKKDIESLKAFITTSKDKERLSYDRRSQFFERQSIFVGTINCEADGEYLKDKTGNRRFLPVKVGKVDFSALKKDRDQLWAEAFSLYNNGYKIFINEDQISMVQQEQENRVENDAWMDCIRDYLYKGLTIINKVKVSDIWINALNMPIAKISRVDKNRIAHCLRQLGYENKVIRDSEGNLTRYFVLNCDMKITDIDSGLGWT